MSIVLYVTDLLDIGSSEVGISKTKEFLMTTFAMKDLGDVSLILGIQVTRDLLNDNLQLTKVTRLCQRNSAAIRVCRQQIGKHTRH